MMPGFVHRRVGVALGAACVLLGALHAAADQPASEPGGFAPIERGTVPPRPEIPRPGGPRPNVWAGEDVATRPLTWLESTAANVHPAPLYVPHWRRFAATIGLSDLQWEASLHRFVWFRGDERRTERWFDDLALDVPRRSEEHPRERARLALAARRFVLNVADENERFFHWLAEEVLDDSQTATSDACRRVARRRILLSGTAHAFENLHDDPDWGLLLALRTQHRPTAADVELLHVALAPWRARADAIAERVFSTGIDYLESDDGSWARMYTDRATAEDFAVERRAAERMLDAQREWLEHCAEYGRIIRPILGDEAADAIDLTIRRRHCRSARLFDPGILDPLRDVIAESGLVRGAIPGVGALLDEARDDLEASSSELCDADRRVTMIEYRAFPVLATRLHDELHAFRRSGDDWFRDAAAVLERADEIIDASADGLPEAERATLRAASATVAELLGVRESLWHEFRATYLEGPIRTERE